MDPDLAKRLEETAAVAVAALRTRAPSGGWVDAYREGDLITTDVAAFVAGVSTETIRRRAVEAAGSGHPLGIQPGTIWLISLARLLDWIERHEGKPARLVAEYRARENTKTRPRPHNSLPFVAATTSAE